MDSYTIYLKKALNFLSFRARSEKEVREHLLKKWAKGQNADAQTIQKVIDFLHEKKFLDDEAFARSWVESRNRSRPKSKRILKMELRQKGVENTIVEKVLEEQGDNELQLAKKIIEKKKNVMKDLSREEVYKKIGGLLARRGFDWDTIKSSIDAEFGW